MKTGDCQPFIVRALTLEIGWRVGNGGIIVHVSQVETVADFVSYNERLLRGSDLVVRWSEADKTDRATLLTSSHGPFLSIDGGYEEQGDNAFVRADDPPSPAFQDHLFRIDVAAPGFTVVPADGFEVEQLQFGFGEDAVDELFREGMARRCAAIVVTEDYGLDNDDSGAAFRSKRRSGRLLRRDDQSG